MRYTKASEKTQYPDWYLRYASSLAGDYPDYSTLDKQYGLYKKLSPLYTALDVVSKIAAPVKHKVKMRAGEDLKDIDNHAYEVLLDRPNPVDSGYAFLKNTVKYLMIGRAFWWLNATNDKAPPSEIWNIPSNRIAPIADGRMGIKGYRYDSGKGEYMFIPPEQIVMFGDGDMLSPLENFSPIETIAMTAQGDLNMQRYNLKLFAGNGRLPGVMTFADPIGNDQWDEIQKNIARSADERNILLLRGTGSGAVNWLQGNNAPRDLEFRDGRTQNRNEIWNTFAQGLVSMLSENATEANARTGKATLIDLVVYPMLQYIDSEVTAKLLPRYGENLVVEPDDIRITDRVIELSEMQEYSKTHSVDEVRKKYWNDKPIGEEIGGLLVAAAQSAQKASDQPIQGAQQPPTDNSMPAEQGNPIVDVEQQKQQATTKAINPRPAMLELDTWERMAKKNLKKSFDFEVYNIPHKLAESIKAELPTCGSAGAVKAVFDTARQSITADAGVVIESESANVLEGLRLTIEAMKHERSNQAGS